jgi:hypothetical protein
VAGTPPTMPLLERAVTAAFAALARLRSARAVHPHGVLLAGRLRLEPGSATAAAIGGPPQRPVLVRASKSAGTPGGWPDVLGLALRVPLDDGPLDLLLATVGSGRLTSWVLAPARGWGRTAYSTLLPYTVDGRSALLGLEPEDPGRAAGSRAEALAAAVDTGPVAFTFVEWTRGGRRAAGRLVLEGRVPDPPPVSFDPVLHHHPRLRLAPVLVRVREWAYTGSRRGRGAPPAAPATPPTGRLQPPLRRGPGLTSARSLRTRA